MTENLLQKLEEKMMALFSELEEARKEIARLHHENIALGTEREKHTRKLQDLLSLLDTTTPADAVVTNAAMQAMKPVLVQG